MSSDFNFDRFTDRFLTPVDKYADLIICAKQCNKYCGFRKIVRRRDGAFEAYCPEDPADAFVIDQQEVLLYNIRESTLVEEIARSLNITPYMAKLANHEHSWKVGNIIVRSESHSVFFTLQWDTELLELILELNRLMHNPYVLLGSSGHMYNNVVAGCLANGDAVFIPLNETIDFNQDAELEQMRPFSWEKLLLPPEALNEEPENIFRKCGDAWEVRFDGGEKYMLTNCNTGAAYLHFMLARPNETTPIMEIIRNVYGEYESVMSIDMLEDGYLTEGYAFGSLLNSLIDNIADNKALRQCKKEIGQIKHDIEMAESNGDNITVEQLEQDLKNLMGKVNEIISPVGQKKKLSDNIKKQVDSFRYAVNHTIDKIALNDLTFAKYLNVMVTFGRSPGYLPVSDISWRL